MIKFKKYFALAFVLTTATTASYAEPETPQAACERLRLQCQKDWAETNSNGVPVTSPEKTKLCWDIYNRCMGAANANQSTTPSAKPDAETKTTTISAMRHFELRGTNESPFIDDCYVNGTEVNCKGHYEKLPAGFISLESTTTGQISNSVIKGNASSRSEVDLGAGCHEHMEDSWDVTITLGPNNAATYQTGPVHFSYINSGGAGCSRSDSGTNAGRSTTMKWRVIE